MSDDDLEPLITQCPNCSTRFRVTETQLQIAEGRVRCGACLTVFQGVEYLILEDKEMFATHSEAHDALDEVLDELDGFGDDESPDIDGIEVDGGRDEPDSPPDSQLPDLGGLGKDAISAGSPEFPSPWDSSRQFYGGHEDTEEPSAADEAQSTGGSWDSGIDSDDSGQRETAPGDLTDEGVVSAEDILVRESSSDTRGLPMAEVEWSVDTSGSSHNDDDAPGQESGDDDEAFESWFDDAETGASADPESDLPDFATSAGPADSRDGLAGEPVGDPDDSVWPAGQHGGTGMDPTFSILSADELATAESGTGTGTGTDSGAGTPELAAEDSAARSESYGPREAVSFAPEPRRWGVGLFMTAAVLALLGQVFYYQFDSWARDPSLRPVYALVCGWTGCELPVLRDLEKMRARNLVVRSHPDLAGALVVDAVIVNEAEYAQPFPALELRFTSDSGNLVAGRRFQPGEYLAGELEGSTLIEPRTPVRIALEIEDPGNEAVNYFLSFRQAKPPPDS